MNSVSIAFELMRLELESEIEQLNAAGAAAFRSSDYEMAEKQIRRGRDLKEFYDRVSKLEDEWRSRFSIEDVPDIATAQERTPEETARKILAHSKASKSSLLVRFGDGTVIAESTAADTLVKSLERIGFDRVERLGVRVNGENIVSASKSEKYNDIRVGNRYVKTHSSTMQKARSLHQISEELGLNLQVQIIE